MLKKDLLQKLVFKLFTFSSIISCLLLSNLEGNDYNTLMSAFSIQQESFGIFFIYVSKFFYYLGLDYRYVHFTYLSILSICITIVTKNPIYILFFIFVYAGSILNEQTRFFTSLFLTLTTISITKKFKILSVFGFFIHPAAFLIGLLIVILNNFMKRLDPKYLFLLIPFFLLFNFILPQFMLFIGGFFGYGYVGSKFLEPISISGYIFLFFSLFCFLIFISKDKLSENYYLLLTICILAIMSSNFAIVSGRLILTYSLFFLCICKPIPIVSSRFVPKGTNFVNALNLLFFFTVVFSFVHKSSSYLNDIF